MFQGMYTRLSDCSSAIVAGNVAAISGLGDRAVLFEDTVDSTLGTASLRYRDVAAGNVLGTGAATLVADQVSSFDTTGPGPGALIYTTGSGGNDDGVFVRYFAP
jgi:hypothetical protein